MLNEASQTITDFVAGAAPAALETIGAATGVASGIDPFVFQFAMFVMAIFVGYYVVWGGVICL